MTGRKRMHGIPQSAIDAGLSFPYLTFVSLPFYHDRRQLAKVTCLQMTESKLFFVWDAMYKPEHIDFFRRLGMIPGGSPPPPPHGPDDNGGGGGEGGGVGGGGSVVGAQETQVVLATGSGVQIEDLLDETTGAGPLAQPGDVDMTIDLNGLLEKGEGEGAEGATGAEEEGKGGEDSDDNSTDDSNDLDIGDDSDDDDDDDDWHVPPHGGGQPLDDIGRDREFFFLVTVLCLYVRH